MINRLIRLTKRLYPTGRAFKLPIGSNIFNLHRGLISSEKVAFDSALNILDEVLPDNDGFTEEDATAWELKLQLPTTAGTTLEQRKESIIRKVRHPGNVLPRQSYRYVQQQLRAAGFPVTIHIHENIFRTAFSIFNEFNSNVNNVKISNDGIFLYVTNTGGDDITIYDINTFQLIGTIGSGGSGNGQFNNPNGVFAFGDFIYIADTGNNRVQVFDNSSREFITAFGTGSSIQFNNVLDITADNDFIFVLDTGNNRVQIFTTRTYNFVGSFGGSGSGNGQFNAPAGIDVLDDRIYVVDTGNNRVQIFDRNTRAFISSFGSLGSGEGQFNAPVAITVDADHMYISDQGNSRIAAFLISDNSFVANNSGLSLMSPNGITNRGSYVYVVDPLSIRIQVFNKENGVTVTPVTVSDNPSAMLFTEHGSSQHSFITSHGFVGSIIATGVVANHLNEADENIGVQSNVSLRSTWFVGDENFPDFIAVPRARERELRNLLLTLKPLHTYAYLMVRFV